MLVELRIENFALMERVHLTFGAGLLAFTGETGAGKSMLVDALDLLLGGRAATESIRHGMTQASVEGVFANLPASLVEILQDEGYPQEDGMLFLSREINTAGRNICRVQGRTVPLSLYRTFCAGLVDIQGQLEHQSLLRQEYHVDLLDRFGGEEHLKLAEEVRKAAEACRLAAAREREYLRSEQDLLRREELLRFQREEIERVAPQPEEDLTLEAERSILLNAEKIMSLVDQSYTDLYQGTEHAPSAFDLLARTRQAMSDLARFDQNSEEMALEVANIYYMLEDIIARIRGYRDSLDFQPGRLDKIERRLVELGKLKKYAADVNAVLQRQKEMAAELEKIMFRKQERNNVHIEKKEALQAYAACSEALSLSRGYHAKRLEVGLAQELSDLGLAEARVEIIFTPVSTPSPQGAELIEFYFSANLGEPPRPLAKVASGGEMARLMLAFKSLLSRLETVDTFIFDEVDSGVGGTTIAKVADKLLRIARDRQVFCITHSVQIAALSTTHYGIHKERCNERTVTRVSALADEAQIKELARMLGGGSKAELIAREIRQEIRNLTQV